MAAAATKAPPIKANQKVVAARELLGVPRGTTGKVLLVGGVTWLRYWVDFDNGVSMAGVDRGALATRDEWKTKRDAVAEEAGETEAVAVGGTEAESAGESIGGIPGHLLERSRRARERMNAKA